VDVCLEVCLDVCLGVRLDVCFILYVEHRVWYHGIIVPIMLGCCWVRVLYR
jgi:hypothetical protein